MSDNMRRTQHEELKPRFSHQGKRHSWLKKVLWIVLIILILIIGFITFKFFELKKPISNAYDPANISKARNTDFLLAAHRPVSLLLLGTDTGALGRNNKGRTDTMIIVTLNPQKHQTTMTSIPRDTAVNIPGFSQYDPSKINAAYAYGSAKTAIQTVQGLLNVPIDYYALINMGGFRQVVDGVGGVTIKPRLTFSYGGFHFVKGQPTQMTGKKALAYVRMRHSDPEGDFGREARQRQLVDAVIHKSGSVTTLLSKSFVEPVSKATRTDITTGNALTLVLRYSGARRNIKTNKLDEVGQVIGGQDMEIPTRQSLQSVTNAIRSELGLSPASTGNAAYQPGQ